MSIEKTLKLTSILLDDDELIRLCWISSASRKGIALKVFKNAKELFLKLHLINKESIFYIDAELGNNKRSGLEVAKELFEKGFQNIYIETGHEPEKFKEEPWIKGVLEKTPAF